jgi:glycosyltransferase involved in cell wall biosynthesis
VKILQLVQKPQLRGAEMFASQLASHLNDAGHEAILVFVFPGEAPLPFTGKKFYLGGRSSKRFFDRAAWKKLAEIIEAEKPDLVQANAGDTLKYAVSSKLFYRWKQPIVFRNASTISLYIKSLPAKLFNGFFFRYADLVASVSRTSAKDFSEIFPNYPNPVVTIPIGIEEPELGTVQKPATIGGAPIRIIHVGGFSFEKNHKGLISIFEKILKAGHAATLELVGNGILKDEIENLVTAKGLNDKVIFHGFRKDAMQLIKQADLLVLPSIIEGLPGVILEAFYCRTPVVAYNVGGISEILIDGFTGYLVEKNDEAAFVKAVLKTVTHPSEAIIGNAARLVKSEYLNTAIAEKFAVTYHNLINK